MVTIDNIKKKLETNTPLTLEDGLFLYNEMELCELGQLADDQNKKINGNKVYYNRNLHLNHTNICTQRCRFCSFSRRGEEPDAYLMDKDMMLEKVLKHQDEKIDEVHIVGGLHPKANLEFFENFISEIKEKLPSISIKALTAVEIDYFAKMSNITVSEVLGRLKEAGLSSLPGGGAEIFAEKPRKKLCPDKISGSEWLDIHGEAHKLGIKTNATMLFGHIESIEDRLNHLIALREQQDETGGFLCFVPLVYHPKNNFLGLKYKTSAVDILKTIALSRLMLNNFKHIKAYWIMLSAPLAQIALSFGANDIDGTIIEEKITHAAGAESEIGLTEDKIRELVTGTGKKPVLRDTLYREM